jgi:dipeptidyl aminopeptidase/acylaminoacyl peptidase
MNAKTRMPRMLALAAVLCLPFSLSAPAQTAAPRGVLAEDYLAYEFAGDPQMSPDGSLVAYVVTKIDRARNRRVSSIWLAAIDAGRAPWQFTTSPQSSNSPRWSPDGHSLAFLSSRETGDAPAGNAPATAGGEAGRSQIFVLSMSGGEAARLTNLKNGVSAFAWSPDGSRMVAISRSGPSDNRKPGGEHSDVRHYKNTSYKFRRRRLE